VNRWGAGQPAPRMILAMTSLIDPLLGEIVDSDLRRKLLQAMWRIADADGWLSDGEAVMCSRAAVAWGQRIISFNSAVSLR
jgi:hypothetical protein